MRRRLTTSLTQLWEASLDARAAISPHSPVSILDELLTARVNPRSTAHDVDHLPDFSPDAV